MIVDDMMRLGLHEVLLSQYRESPQVFRAPFEVGAELAPEVGYGPDNPGARPICDPMMERLIPLRANSAHLRRVVRDVKPSLEEEACFYRIRTAVDPPAHCPSRERMK